MRRMSAVPGFGDLLQIPIRMPDLVSSEKRKQGLALVMKNPHQSPFFKGGTFSFSYPWVNAREINSAPPFYRQSC